MRKSKKQNRPMNNKTQKVKQMAKVENEVAEATVNEIEQQTAGPEENPVLRISELHFAKLQEMSEKGMQVAQASSSIYQREFALKDAIKKIEELKKDKEELDAFNTELIREDNQLRDELIREYGNIKLNTQTGEYTLEK